MGSLKGVWLNGCAPSHRSTPHNQILPIRQVMVSSPLHAETGTVQSARQTRVISGYETGNKNYFRSSTIT
jgi:hypothetical protein